MSSVVEIDMEAVLPDRAAVFEHQGIPADAEISERIEALYTEAMRTFSASARPIALTRDIDRTAFEMVFAGDGKNADDAVPGFVAADAVELTLFAATVGAGVTDKIDELFASNDFALASMTDSVASRAADLASAALAEIHHQRLIESGTVSPDQAVLGYSPGYCGWHISGQRRLFEYLQPETIGISLNSSCMMSPLKSVSGVLIAAEPDAHRFTPRFSYCPECKDRSCIERMQQLPKRRRVS